MSEQRATIILRRADGTEIDLTDEVRATYDIAVGSMDFGSGFLSTEEVTHLRRVQAALGAEPLAYDADPCEDCAHIRSRHYGLEDGCRARLEPSSNGPAGGFVWTDEPRRCPCSGFTFEGERRTP